MSFDDACVDVDVIGRCGECERFKDPSCPHFHLGGSSGDPWCEEKEGWHLAMVKSVIQSREEAHRANSIPVVP